ncbi:MAG: NAD-dependent epimerase/dehydratase family protein [SAR202 cluster bacterium]|nr:nucleotide sugar epimerase [Chloroflexota bacterium]MQG22915.1 NAD-dependent epimerase/dehydratase family protein [SAR202 cluster bacterium]|tara:strand:- start:3241 stop:4209 length:969 start_codon:yes stop_codon:yes gene_type:complete
MNKYIVTGAAGFIASVVSTKLLESGHEVVGIDNLNDAYDITIKNWRLEKLQDYTNFNFIQNDISTSSRGWTDSFKNADSILHLAGRAGVRQSVETPHVYVESNVLGTLNVLEAVKDHNIHNIVIASTSSVYGSSLIQPYDEDSESSKVLSPYAASKKSAETLAYAYHHLYGINTQILRFFTVYGPAGRPDMSIFRFIKGISDGSEILLYGNGGERDFTYVDDIAEGVCKAAVLGGYNIINLGGDNPVRIKKIIELIEKYTSKSASIKVVGRDPADVPSTWANINTAKDVLSWQPNVSIEVGISRTVDWYKDNYDWAKKIDIY